MSALAWFFGLGALAVAFPLLFHLIRRTPKGQTEFSSLMFLKPTPPTLTRRSRLDNLLLLLMRAAAICLIAFAFMRPFFRGADTLSEVEMANRRVAILIDTSASMQRTGLWQQVKQQVESVLADLESGDDVALLAFDDSVRTVVDFDAGAEAENVDRSRLIREGLNTLEPGWQRSDLGKALVSVADSLDIWRDSQQAKGAAAPAKLQIVLVSDLQKGSRIDSLQSYQWPAHVYVKFNAVVPADYSNATVQLLDSAAESDDSSLRVRVANSEESKLDQFFVNWSGQDLRETDQPISFYVPAGTSHVLKVSPDEAIRAQQFTVSGDGEDFDNIFFVVPAEQQELNITYIGNDDPDDPEQPQYYLRRALIETPARTMKMRQLGANEKITEGPRPAIVFLASAVSETQRDDIDDYLESGGTLAVVLSDTETVESTVEWTAGRARESVNRKNQSRDNYQMLAEIDFSSQLFQPFANSRYNDFTKIRFWNHQSVELIDDAVAVLARFENDDPAVWRRTPDVGGQVVVFASGWQPSQSQLALSSKFVPLINGLIEIAADLPELNKSLLVGDAIVFPASGEFTKRVLIKPDGSRESIEPAQTNFDGVDQPGIYRVKISDSNPGAEPASLSNGSRNETLTADSDGSEANRSGGGASGQAAAMMFAVNVDRAESETAAIPVEQIEMFEVKVGEQETAANELAQMREMRDRDIESQQKIWKWLIVAALLLLIGETWLAGRTGSRMLASDNESEFALGRLSGETT